jgi:hypothetical protein
MGILLILVSIGALVAWEKWGKDRFLYEEVPVLARNVEKGTVITEDMVELVKMDVREGDCITAKQVKSIIGREAAFFVHKGVPLFSAYFAQAGLTPVREEGTYYLSVPDDWLVELPKNLQRGDQLYFFKGERFLTSAPVSSVDEEGKSVEVVVDDKQAAALAKTTGDGARLVVIYN